MRLYFCISRSYSVTHGLTRLCQIGTSRSTYSAIRQTKVTSETHRIFSSDDTQAEVNLHPERWKSHKKILNLSFGTSGEWQSVRSAPLEIFYQVDLFLLRYEPLDITAGDKYCGTLLKEPVRFPCILRCMDFESRNTKLYGSGSICSKAIQRTKPDSHDAIIAIARKKRYTCAVASLQSPASDSNRFVFTECNR